MRVIRARPSIIEGCAVALGDHEHIVLAEQRECPFELRPIAGGLAARLLPEDLIAAIVRERGDWRSRL
jgi:hypothetical protein